MPRLLFVKLPLLLSCLLGALAQAAPAYRVTLIGPPPDDSLQDTYPAAIGPTGAVAGQSGRVTFVQTNDKLHIMGPLPGGHAATPHAINSSGVIVGGSDSRHYWHAFKYEKGVMTDLHNPGYPDAPSIAHDINDQGMIVGSLDYRPAFYQDGAMRHIPGLEHDHGAAYAVNNAGTVVGDGDVPFIYKNGELTLLRNIGGGTLNGINDNGLIMGTMGSDWEGYRAKLYDDGVLTDIGAGVAGNTYSRALNNHGAALFDARGPTWTDSTAYLYVDGVATELNTLVDPALGLDLRYGEDINDRGQIVATGCGGGYCRSVLLDPISAVPEPGAALMLLAGLGVVAHAGRRRRLSAGG